MQQFSGSGDAAPPPAHWRWRLWRAVDRLRGRQATTLYPQLLASQFFSAERVAQEADRQRDELARYAAHSVPYYRELATGGQFSRFPILPRDVLQREPDRLLAAGRNGPLQELRTSGTTGQVVRVWRDRPMQDLSTACAWRGDCWGSDLAPWDRELLLWGTPRDINAGGALGIRITLLWRNKLLFESFAFDAARARALNRMLWRYRPRVLTSYPTSIVAYVHFARELGLNPPPLAKVLPICEECDEADRAELAEYFQAPVLGRYGSHELGCIAHQCERGTWHLHSEGVLLEVLTADGKIATRGTGALLCTTLANYAMPLIRYAIGDWAELSDEQCSCGRGLPVLKDLSGRAGQFVYTPDGRWITSHGFLAPLRWVPVRDFRLIQDEPGRVTLLLAGPRLDGALLARLRDEYDKLHGGTLEVSFEQVDDIPPLANGKRTRVICSLPRPDNVKID